MNRLRTLARKPTSFRGAVLTLLSSSSLAVGITFLAQPVLTRLYAPEAFGTLDSFIAIVAVLAPVVSLRYEDALMLPERDEDAAHVFWLTSLLVLTATAATVLVVYLLNLWADIPLLSEWGWLLPVAVLAFRGQKLLEYWFTRRRHFRVVAAGQLSDSLLKTGLRIGLGLSIVGIGAAGLFGGYFAGLAIALLLYVGFLGSGELRVLVQHLSWEGIRRAARRYKRFPMFSASSQACYALAMRLPFLLLLAFFGEAVVGQYGRAFVILAVPMSMLGASVARVYKIRGVEAHRSEGLTRLTKSLYEQLLHASLFPAVAVIITGPELLALFFGEEWLPAGRYLQYVGPWLLLAGIASPLTPIFDILERQKDDLMTGIVLFIFPAAALLLGGYLGDLSTTLLLVGIAGAVTRLFHLNRMLALAGVPVAERIRPFDPTAKHVLPYLLLLLGILYVAPPVGDAWVAIGLIALHVLRTARKHLTSKPNL